MRPRLLDLFCGAGGAGAGYQRAGFDVTGVDNRPQRRYPYAFLLADALDVLADRDFMAGFDAVHASPPCQAYSQLGRSNPHRYPDLVGAVRDLLAATGLPYVIENVEGAPLRNPIVLCGSMFGLGADRYQLRRHRLFEATIPLPQLACAHDDRPVIGVYGGKARLRRRTPHWGTNLPKAAGEQAMGADWMTLPELSEAIPPAYAQWVGGHLIRHLRTGVAA